MFVISESRLEFVERRKSSLILEQAGDTPYGVRSHPFSLVMGHKRK